MSSLLADYTDLITPQHQVRPRFLATVTALADFAVDGTAVVEHLPTDFDLDAAVGAQLDAVGLWAGITRVITIIPSEAYPAPPDAYQVSLDDDTFRRLIRARILSNQWDGTPEDAALILDAFYGPPGTYAGVIDNQDMSIDLILTGAFPTAAEAAVFSQMILAVRPAGVRIRDTHVSPAGGPIFGLDVANDFINGPDVGSFGEAF